MREIRTYGSEGGAVGQPTVPTPIREDQENLDSGLRRNDEARASSKQRILDKRPAA
jgi:hypothetical protein